MRLCRNNATNYALYFSGKKRTNMRLRRNKANMRLRRNNQLVFYNQLIILARPHIHFAALTPSYFFAIYCFWNFDLFAILIKLRLLFPKAIQPWIKSKAETASYTLFDYTTRSKDNKTKWKRQIELLLTN